MPPLDLTTMETKCQPHALISRGEFVLENNTWGVGQVSTYSQCVHAALAGGSPPPYAWTWDFPPEATDSVKSYPEIIYGKKPWAGSSTTVRLPRPLSPIPSFSVDFDLQVEATGRYNTAFEIWLTTGSSATEAQISHEVMFWVGRAGGATPAGQREAHLTMPDGRGCELWAGQISSWRYRAFVFDQPISSGTIEFGYYLDYLVRTGWMPAGLFIASLELGNEVWFGRGTTALNRYEVSIGSTLPTPTPVVPVTPPVVPVTPTPTPFEPPETPTFPTAPAPGIDPTRAVIEIDVPTSARVYIDDNLMQSISSHRVFASPPLGEEDYLYRVRVILEEPGRYVEERRDVVVRAGTVVQLSFTYLAGTG